MSARSDGGGNSEVSDRHLAGAFGSALPLLSLQSVARHRSMANAQVLLGLRAIAEDLKLGFAKIVGLAVLIAM